MATTKAFELAQLSALTAVDASGNVTASTNTIANASGHLTVDSVGDLHLDVGGQIKLDKNGVLYGNLFNSSNDLGIHVAQADQRLVVSGSDGGTPVNAFILDMANGGRATFSENVVVGDTLSMQAGSSAGKFAVMSTAVHASYDFYNNGTSYFNDQVNIDGVLHISDTTTSTSSASGSLQVLGGAGIAENLNVGGNVVVTGDFTVQGTSATLNTTDLNVEDKNITLNYHATANTSATAGGSGITIQDAVDGSTDASILWDATDDKFTMSHGLTLLSANHLQFTRGGEIRSEDTGGTVRTLVRVNGSNELEYGWSGSGPVKFMGGGSYTEKIRIHTDGNVGIGGVDTPVTALHVDPGYVTLGASDGTDNSWINNVEDGNLELVNEGRSTNDGAVRINRKNNPAGDTTYFRDTAIYDGKDNIVLFVDGSEAEVGIGTSSPSDRLEVLRTSTDQTVGLTLTNTQAGGYGSGIVWKSKRGDSPYDILTAAKIVVAGANSWGSDGNTASQMQFWTQKDNTLTKHMTLSKNGYLGIGTPSPNATLALSDGTDVFDFGVTANLLMIKSVTADGSDDQRIILDAGNGGQSSTRGAFVALSGNEASNEPGKAIYQMGNVTGSSHVFRKAGGVDAVIIDEDGQVGIGASPGRLLDIHKTDATQYDRSNISNSNSGATIRIINNDVANGPSYAGIHLQTYGASANIARAFIGVVNDENWINGGWSGTHHHLTFATRTSNFGNIRETMILTSDGNLGIGEDWGDLSTKRPMHKLDVDGAIATRQVRHNSRPTLNLDFANTKELDDRISFYRNSVATYYDAKGIIRYANVNQPRFDHDPTTKEPKGLLVESSARNDIQTPHDFSTAFWARPSADLFIYSNSALAPDETMSASRFVPGGIFSRKTIYRSPGIASGWNTFSVFAKADGYSTIVIGGHRGANSSGFSYKVSLTTGEFVDVTTQSVTTHTHSEQLNDGWWRISVSFNNNNSCDTVILGVFDATDISSFEPNYRSYQGTGDGIKGVYLWGAQLERNPYLTSFIQPVTEFTDRTTAATYHNEDGILVEAPRDEPRYGYAWNGKKWIRTGLLIEAQSSTNLFPQSNIDFDALWIPQSSTGFQPFYNSSISPDGSQGTACHLTTNSLSGNVVYRNATAITTSSNKYTFSMYAKANGTDVFELRFDFPALKKATFDLTNGTITQSTDQANYPGAITYAGNGWWRCSISSNVNAQITNVVFSGSTSVASNDILVWGPQLETNTTPTSFIYTNATRAAEVLYNSDAFREPDYARVSVKENDWYNYDEGTLMVSAVNGTRSGYGPRVAYLSNGSSLQRMGMYVSGSGNLRFLVSDGGTSIDTVSGSYYADYGDSFKFAASWKQADVNAIDNGDLQGSTSSSITIPQDITHLNIGAYYDSDPQGVIHIKKLEYYQEKVADATLQALTENN